MCFFVLPSTDSICVLIIYFRGVRRLSVRLWDKAVADGNVEQMFGMNIKQEGIEVQGDQVGVVGL